MIFLYLGENTFNDWAQLMLLVNTVIKFFLNVQTYYLFQKKLKSDYRSRVNCFRKVKVDVSIEVEWSKLLQVLFQKNSENGSERNYQFNWNGKFNWLRSICYQKNKHVNIFSDL